MGLGPDGKIYVSSYYASQFLSTIHNPDVKGVKCDFRPRDFKLEPNNRNIGYGIPDFPHYRVPKNTFNCVTLSNSEIESTQSESLQIYPNPVVHRLYIKSTHNLDGKNAVIYNNTGERVNKNIISGNSINVENLSPGLYYLQITLDEKVFSNPFLKY